MANKMHDMRAIRPWEKKLKQPKLGAGKKGKLIDRGGSGQRPMPAVMPSTEIEKRFKKLEKSSGGSKPLVTNVGDSTYEWTEEYTWIAYASNINNASGEGVITSQQDAVGFSFSAISESGDALNWLGYWTSKSLVQSGDPTDYIWTDLTADIPASSITLYYTESTELLTDIGDPDFPVTGVTWTSFTGSTPASAFWVATRYTVNGTKTPWRIIPVRTKQNDLGLIIHTISGNKPAMNSAQWKADAITAISVFTGRTYSTTNEMGYGTTIGITYDDGKLFGMLKEVGGVATWVTTSTFIDGELLVTETVVADKIGANAITTAKLAAGSITSSKLVVSGTGAIGAATIGAATIAANQAAQATADGEIIGYFQNAAPDGSSTPVPSFGDIWIDTDKTSTLNSTSIHRYQDSSGGSQSSLSWVATPTNALGLIYLDAYTAQATGNTAITNAATAQTAANSAATAATNAQNTANTATSTLSDIADDDKITPVEKLQVKALWDVIVLEKPGIATSAGTLSVSTTLFDAAYNNLYSLINTLTHVFDDGSGNSNMDTTTTLQNTYTRSVWDSRWSAYYDKKQDVLDGIAAALKVVADAAQTTAESKIKTFYQDGVPTSLTIGDLWVDTNDDNRLYKAVIAGANEITTGEWEPALDEIYTSNTTTIDGGKITAGSVTANQVTLVPGDVGVGTASGDDSLRITATTIKIYDGGTLRVKLGNLA